MKQMKRRNEQDDGVKGRKKCSHPSHPDGIGDYVRLCEISIRTNILLTLTHHTTSGIYVRFWRAVSKKSPQ